MLSMAGGMGRGGRTPVLSRRDPILGYGLNRLESRRLVAGEGSLSGRSPVFASRVRAPYRRYVGPIRCDRDPPLQPLRRCSGDEQSRRRRSLPGPARRHRKSRLRRRHSPCLRLPPRRATRRASSGTAGRVEYELLGANHSRRYWRGDTLAVMAADCKAGRVSGTAAWPRSSGPRPFSIYRAAIRSPILYGRHRFETVSMPKRLALRHGRCRSCSCPRPTARSRTPRCAGKRRGCAGARAARGPGTRAATRS